MAEQTSAIVVSTQPDGESAQWHEQIEQSPQIGWLDRVKFALVRGILAGTMRLVGLRGLYWFSCAFGTCEWLVLYRMRRRVKARLTRMLGAELPPRQISRAVHRFFRRVRCDKTVYLIFDRLDRRKVLDRIEFENRHHVDEALRRGNGAYIMLSHHGAHHVAALLMALQGYKTAGVRDRKESNLRRYVQWRYAQSFPEFRRVQMFYAGAFPRDLYRCFRENWVIGTALDVDRDRGRHLRTFKVRLFDQEQSFLTGTARIALRCGTPILQGFVVSGPGFRFRLVVTEPLWNGHAAPESEDAAIEQIMRRYAANIEQHVRRYPCHISKF